MGATSRVKVACALADAANASMRTDTRRIRTNQAPRHLVTGNRVFGELDCQSINQLPDYPITRSLESERMAAGGDHRLGNTAARGHAVDPRMRRQRSDEIGEIAPAAAGEHSRHLLRRVNHP